MKLSITPPSSNISPIIGIILTLVMVIIVRESCVLLCQYLSIDNAGNVMGLIVMFVILFLWRLLRMRQGQSALPIWMMNASNKILVDSGFAFLPISAGAGILLFSMQDEFWGVLATMLISTLLPMWALAKLADYWLESVDESSSTQSISSNNNSKEQEA